MSLPERSRGLLHAAVCSRRGFLFTLLAAAAAVAGCGEQGASRSADVPSWLPGAVGDVGAAARLGRSYLADHPHEQQLDTLLDALDGALGAEAGTGAHQPQRLLAALQDAVQADYRSDAVVSVQGWVLSVTEARVYALLALAAAN